MRSAKENLKTLTPWRRKNRQSREQIIELIKQYLSNANTRQRTERELVKLGKQALDALIYVLRHPELPSIYRGWVGGILSQIGEPAFEPSLALLQDENEDVRGIAAGVLGRMGDERAVDPLIRAMRDKSANVRVSVIQGLLAIGEPRAAPFIQYFLRDENLQVRLMSIYAMGALRNKQAVEALIALLHDKDESIRTSTISALVSISDARAIEPILVALNDIDPHVRLSAALALGHFADPRAIEPLINSLSDNASIPVEFPYDGIYLTVREGVQDALQVIGEPAVKPLLTALNHPNNLIRVGAATILSRWGNQEAIEQLYQLASDDTDYYVQERARIALRFLPKPKTPHS